MVAAAMDLAAIGPQNMYLTANPEITFFKQMYKKHTNFSMEEIAQNFMGVPDFGKTSTVQISRSGDLVHDMTLEITLPALSSSGGTVAWTNNIGNQMIKSTRYEIGSTKMDQHYGDFMHIWSELTIPEGHRHGYNVMIGNTSALTTEAPTIPQTKIRVPLFFDFCLQPGLALPLIALQYHDVKFYVEFRQFSECYVSSSGTVAQQSLVDCQLYVNYIFLDVDERKKFAQNPHEVLVTELQFTGQESFTASNTRQAINFNHPIKELIWVTQPQANTANGANRWSDYTDSGSNVSAAYNGNSLLASAQLQLNGQDRFSLRDSGYFNQCVPLKRHTCSPSEGIYVYSFALKPEEHQPTGTCNFSRIDNAYLMLNMNSAVATDFRVYGRNYNIIRYVSGMGGKAYSS